jgi:hypothetical protein
MSRKNTFPFGGGFFLASRPFPAVGGWPSFRVPREMGGNLSHFAPPDTQKPRKSSGAQCWY